MQRRRQSRAGLGQAIAHRGEAQAAWPRSAVPRPRAPSLDAEYGFLAGLLVDAATLRRARALAERWNVTPQDVLLANGWTGSGDYARALAESCRVSFRDARHVEPVSAPLTPKQALETGLLAHRGPGPAGILVSPAGRRPAEVRAVLDATRAQGMSAGLAVPRHIRQAVLRANSTTVTAHAIDGLARRYPHESAAAGLTRHQRLAIAVMLAVLVVAGVADIVTTLRVLAAIATLFFCLVVALRVFACINLIAALPKRLLRRSPPRIPDAELPVYTVLVPLFRERNMLAGLAHALARLDYPAARLDIKLIFEEVDADTIAAAKRLSFPGNVEFVTVPDAGPRTKPKALNYALQLARGEFAVIYDAEDRPDPDQLRSALAAFRAGPPNLACVQARLNVYNADENWLTRQFAIEYAALFDGLLPALQRLGLPIPLGGTSNHFRVSALKWLGAWDAWNVTEDADLGMRLCRRGYVCRVIASSTLEEAPCRPGTWLRQRTRWMKGFIQTWFVHMRRPVRLWRELGPHGFFGFQAVVGGIAFSAVVHPVFYLLVALEAAADALLILPGSLLGLHLWLIALFNVAAGYVASMLLGLAALRWRGIRLTPHVLFMPLYWLLVSAAAYRALVQLLRAPFYWEKTEHGLSAHRPPQRR